MTNEQLVALLTAITTLIVAIGAVLQQIIALRHAVNGRLGELLELTRSAAEAQGRLAGRLELTAEQQRPQQGDAA